MRPGESTKINLPVVGIQYRMSISTRRMLKKHVDEEEVQCILVREPLNLHDTNAVKVIVDTPPYKGFHIGYIDRIVAATLAPVLDIGTIVAHAVITEMDIEASTAVLSVTLKTPGVAKKKVPKKKSPKRA